MYLPSSSCMVRNTKSNSTFITSFFCLFNISVIKGFNINTDGCHIKGMNKYIDKGHCSHGHEWQSFSFWT